MNLVNSFAFTLARMRNFRTENWDQKLKWENLPAAHTHTQTHTHIQTPLDHPVWKPWQTMSIIRWPSIGRLRTSLGYLSAEYMSPIASSPSPSCPWSFLTFERILIGTSASKILSGTPRKYSNQRVHPSEVVCEFVSRKFEHCDKHRGDIPGRFSHRPTPSHFSKHPNTSIFIFSEDVSVATETFDAAPKHSHVMLSTLSF